MTKIHVSDAAVAEYASRIRAGIPLGTLFPAKMSDCDFTEHQRQVIRHARTERKKTQKKANVQSVSPAKSSTPAKAPVPVMVAAPKAPKTKGLTKLRKMLYLQSGRCFFCGEPLKEEEASIEHLKPKSLGGASAEDNEVVCHASLNETFGAMDLKRKFEFVLKSAGKFTCPGK
jgi:5-methylcytosine-specific restriction endonuclease McrA